MDSGINIFSWRENLLDVIAFPREIPAISESTHSTSSTFRPLSQFLKAGGIIGGAKESELEILSGFGRRVGLAFQIVDDILDATSNEKDLGKTTDLDSKQGKVNFVTLFGLNKSRKKVQDLIIQAKSELEKLSVNTENLVKIAEFVETRKN